MNDDQLPTRSPQILHVEDLGELIRAKRKADGLTLDQASHQIGVSAATLSRLERLSTGARAPDVRTLSAVARWLGISIQKIKPPDTQEVVLQEGQNTPAIVEAHLRADRKLDPKTAAALSELFRAAYEQFAKLSDQSLPPTNNTEIGG